MSRNIELKAYCSEIARLRKTCAEIGLRLIRKQSQRDTYFAASHGRLKLREADSGAPALIHYDRMDTPLLRESSYSRVELDTKHGEMLREILSKAIGVRQVVIKQREIYENGGAVVNIDQVEGLGTFIELEVGETVSEKDPENCAQWLKTRLGIQENDIIPWSYAELKAMKTQAIHWRAEIARRKSGCLFLIDGPSASGKTTVATFLRKRFPTLAFARRHCTRGPRSEEEKEYIFVSQEIFRNLAYNGDFLEYRDFEFGMSYGIAWQEALGPVLTGKSVVALMNWGNARHIRQVFPDSRIILVTASENVLRQRLINRGVHDEAQLDERLANARRLPVFESDYDLIVDSGNESLVESVERVGSFIQQETERRLLENARD